jgi:hypothetical protein
MFKKLLALALAVVIEAVVIVLTRLSKRTATPA